MVSSFAKFLGKSYTAVASYRMWEIGIVVFAVNCEIPNISNVVTKHEATGVGIAKGYTGVQLGNKGGVAVGFKWHDVSLCFVNAHLAAKPHRVKERNADYSQISKLYALPWEWWKWPTASTLTSTFFSLAI